MPASSIPLGPSGTRSDFPPTTPLSGYRRLGEYAAHELRAPRSRGKRRREKRLRFVILEAVALTWLVTSAMIGRAEALIAPSYNSLCVAMLFMSAAAVVAVPVWFYGLPKQRA